MSDLTKIINGIDSGDPSAADRLLPLVYSELRLLAAAKLAKEKTEQTLQATALVHEAYLRLVDADPAQVWNGRAHFFGAAAEAMRRIIVERARSKRRLKRGGDGTRVKLEQELLAVDAPNEQLLAIDEALSELEKHDPQAAQLVKLRYFVGMEHQESAHLLGISRRAADRLWLLARTWLAKALRENNQEPPK